MKDKWGLNTFSVATDLKENEQKMVEDMEGDAKEMLERVGLQNVKSFVCCTIRGATYEMGSARMGYDPKNSVLNKWNQVWDAANVFVNDGSFMISSSCVNPSLIYMAFTARAADYAVVELKKRKYLTPSSV